MRLLIVVTLLLSGCAGEMYLGARRIDEYRAEQRMRDKPLKCLFVSCADSRGGSEANGS